MTKKLLGLFAHPDDEILGPGGTLALLAAQGVEVELICATRGEAGEIAHPSLATPDTLASVRESEMLCSAKTLGVKGVTFLDYRDSGMEGTEENEHPDAFINAPAEEVVNKLVTIIRRKRPQVIITFEPYGGYGHPDHIAINRHTLSAFDKAADPEYRPDLDSAWQAARLFYDFLPITMFVEMKQRMEARGLDVSFFDGFEKRRVNGWPDDQVHCVIDVSEFVETKWEALRCHRTQYNENGIFRSLPEDEMMEIFSREYFALVRPEPEPGLQLTDLFDQL